MCDGATMLYSCFILAPVIQNFFEVRARTRFRWDIYFYPALLRIFVVVVVVIVFTQRILRIDKSSYFTSLSRQLFFFFFK
eukprot:SAG31_NODE_7639_length_1633_cov_1.378748_1_plen_79_part_10